jgi:beta-galactosidase
VSSEETSAENAGAAKAFDGKPETFWHTEWSRRQAPYPHSLTIDLGAPTEIVGVRLLPRQTGPQNGRPKRFRLFLDGALVLEDAAPDSATLIERRFPRVKGRLMRLEFLDGHRPEPFLALAEVGLIRPTRSGGGWNDQYSIADVLSGGARLDPSGPELERLRRAEMRSIGAWQSATLPHAAWVRPLDDPEIWQGVAYYRRQIPKPTAGMRTELVVQGMQSLDVWLNGRRLAARRGGYLPLRVPVAEGGELLVRVDNRDNALIPPGKPQGQLDFMYGNGLIGHATLETTDTLHVVDPLEDSGGIRVEPPRLGKGSASTWIHTNVRNDGVRVRRFVVRQTILDDHGQAVATRMIPARLPAGRSERFAQRLTVPHAKLWSPASPMLYRLRTSIEEGGRIVDSIETRIGFRTIEVSRERGFVLNGKPLRLVGTNRHQDYPWVGPALSDTAQRRDALLIKRSGHNIVRLSHYDQSPAFLDACDELGILTIPCIPGWQFVNRDPRFLRRVDRDIRQTVRRDRNHPSVAFWEASLNETYVSGALAKAWCDAAKAEGANLTAGDQGRDTPWDIAYNGWKEDLSRPSDPSRPGYIREYGDYEFGGGSSTSRVRIREGITRLLNETWNHVWSYNKFRPQYPSTMGAGTWEMFDHNVPWDFSVSASGLADLMRREKPSFWFYASQDAAKPYLKVAADWQPGTERRNVVVFTNAPEATLVLNGRRIWTAKAVPGPSTPYDLHKSFDGTNTDHLPHPPIVFRDVPFLTGELKVVGSNGARDAIRTAGKPTRLKMWIDDLGVSPTTNDLVFVRAAVVDAKGVVCPNESRTIRFAGAPFAGEDHARCEMGVASVLVRTPVRPGTLTVRASAGSLYGTCSLRIGR